MLNERNPLLLGENSPFDYTEAYVRLRTNFIYITMNGTYKKVLFTSCEPSEGKSITVLNLATSLAKSGKRVLLLECDLRRPALRKYTGMTNEKHGLSDILCNILPVQDCVNSIEELGIDVIFSGSSVPNPSELLGSDNMRELLKAVEGSYDYVLLDCPPVLSVSDPAILATMADGVVFVVRQGRVRRQQYSFAIHELETVGAKLLGTVMSVYKSKRDHFGYSHGYGYAYRYGYKKRYYYDKK